MVSRMHSRVWLQCVLQALRCLTGNSSTSKHAVKAKEHSIFTVLNLSFETYLQGHCCKAGSLWCSCPTPLPAFAARLRSCCAPLSPHIAQSRLQAD